MFSDIVVVVRYTADELRGCSRGGPLEIRCGGKNCRATAVREKPGTRDDGHGEKLIGADCVTRGGTTVNTARNRDAGTEVVRALLLTDVCLTQ